MSLSTNNPSHRNSWWRPAAVLSTISLVAAASLALLNQGTQARIAQLRIQSQLSALVTLLSRSSSLPKLQELAGSAGSAGSSRPSHLELAALYQLALETLETLRQEPNSEPRPELDSGASSEPVQAVYHIRAAAAQWQGRSTPELYILQLRGYGFGGPMELYAAYRPDASLYHAVLLENSETPGFGKKAEDPSYMKLFWDKGPRRASPKGSSQKAPSPTQREAQEPIPVGKQQLKGVALDAVTGSTISFNAIASTLLAGAQWISGQHVEQSKAPHNN